MRRFQTLLLTLAFCAVIAWQAAAQPVVPVNISPAYGATNVPTRTYLTWVGQGDSYTVEIHDQPWPWSNPRLRVQGIEDPEKSYFTYLTPNTKYYWRVSATDASGTSQFSTIWEFTTGTNVGEFTNGSFERSKLNPENVYLSNFNIPRGSDGLYGWIIENGDIDLNGTNWEASEGSNSIDMSGRSAGTISQSFQTTAGQRYRVTFALAGNVNGGSAVKRMRVDVAGTSQTFAFDITGKSEENMGWREETIEFTASASSSKLWFTSLENSFFGPVLDNVRVSPVKSGLQAPNLQFPINGSSNLPTENYYYWSKVEGAEKYIIEFSINPWPWQRPSFRDTIDVPEIQYFMYLTPNQKYYWRVWAWNTSGDGPPSDVWNFTTGMAKPHNFTNGSFELSSKNPGDSLIVIGAKHGNIFAIYGWGVGSGEIDYLQSYWQSSTGARSLDLNGASKGVIQQYFATQPGTRYRINFDMAGNPEGPPNVKKMLVNVEGGGQELALQEFSFDATGRTKTSMGWQRKSIDFTANSDGAALLFYSQVEGSFGPALDNVTVTELTSGDCSSLTLSTARQDFTAQGGTRSFTTSASDQCSWSARADQSWVHSITPANSSGNKTVSYTVDINPTTTQRATTIRVTGGGTEKTLVVAQAGQTVQLPDPPILISPTNGATGVSTNATLQWGTAARAATYTCQVHDAPWPWETPLLQRTVTATSLSVALLLPGKTYFWRVWSTDSQGNNSALSSPVWSFTTAGGSTNRLIKIADTPALVGNPVRVPITCTSQGDENAFSFTAAYATAILSNPKISLGKDMPSGSTFIPNLNTAGKIGVLISLPTGRTLSSGAREILTITFDVPGGSQGAEKTQIVFEDNPIPRRCVDVNGNNLAATWVGGTIGLSRGFESDVHPSPHGNDVIDVSDWVRVGRLVAGLEAPQAGTNEFQRADTAPRDVRGDGQLSLADWVQAGRDAARLDAWREAGGPMGGVAAKISSVLSNNGARIVSLRDRKVLVGPDSFSVELLSEGDENAISFSLGWDSGVLSNPRPVLGKDAVGGQLVVNDKDTATGKMGILLALPAGQTFAAGARQIIIVSFQGLRESSNSNLRFGDEPVKREIIGAELQPLSAEWRVERTTAAGEKHEGVPLKFAIEQNTPNPFNAETEIRFQTPMTGYVELAVFDMTGRQVADLINGNLAAGDHVVHWGGSGLPSGIYFYRLKADGKTLTRKMILAR